MAFQNYHCKSNDSNLGKNRVYHNKVLKGSPRDFHYKGLLVDVYQGKGYSLVPRILNGKKLLSRKNNMKLILPH